MCVCVCVCVCVCLCVCVCVCVCPHVCLTPCLSQIERERARDQTRHMSFVPSLQPSACLGNGLRRAGANFTSFWQLHRWMRTPRLSMGSLQGFARLAPCGVAQTSPSAESPALGSFLPSDTEGKEVGQHVRIVIVSRRHLRKNKYVDFVGEYHIDLLQRFGAVPILIPRTAPTTHQLEAYLAGGVDGVLVMEGSDLGEQYKPYGNAEEVPADVANEVCAQHANDVEVDETKDGLEMRLIRDQVLGQGVPYLGLCRGCQMLNVALGGTLYFDVEAETRCARRDAAWLPQQPTHPPHPHPHSIPCT